MKKLFALLLFAAMAMPALAATDWVEVESKGQGATRDKAIQDALYLAVCKVQGVAVRSDIARVNVAMGSMDVRHDDVKGTKSVEVEGVSANMAGTLSLTESQGLVKTYSITDEKKVDPNTYEVSMKVLVYDYHGPEDTTKLRLAVFPLEPRAASYSFGRVVMTGRQLGEQFSQVLCSMLVQNEKFTVLDRQSQEAIFQEKKILYSDDASIEEKARLGSALGADYMLVGTIPQAELRVTEYINQAIGAPTREFDAAVTVEFRVLVGPTRQVVCADQVHIKLEDAEVRALIPNFKPSDVDYVALETELVRRVARQIADSTADHLYPIRVAAVKEDGTIILNRGGKGFASGDIFEMYKVGNEIIDPETGKSLGKDEAKFGTIKITNVLPRISYAELVNGAIGQGAVGSVVRRAKPAAMPVMPSRTPTVTETPSGGVVLPGDDRGSSTVIRKK